MINAAIITGDVEFAKYLAGAKIKPANKGGAFVGSYKVAPESFKKYGIVLPNGGMIIPDLTADELKGESKEARRILLEQVEKRGAERAVAEDVYLASVSELLARYNIPGLAIVGCRKEDMGCSWGAAFLNVFCGEPNPVSVYTLLAFGEDAAFLLRREYQPSEDFKNRPEFVQFTPIEEVEQFLQAEARIYPEREKFLSRLQAVTDWNKKKNLELRQSNRDEEAYRDSMYLIAYGNHWSGSLDFGPMQVGLKSAYCLIYREKTYHFSEEDVAFLENEIGHPVEEESVRRERLWNSFVVANGVLVRTGEAYFVGGERITPVEREWLLSRSGEIKMPEGYVLVRSDTNALRPFIEMPGQNDILVVEGKIGSRRGVCSFGEWFRGHPSQCSPQYWEKKGRIKSVVLNGQVQESKEVDFTLWTDPRKLAGRALREAGMDVLPAYAEALAQIYACQLGKPLEPWRFGMRY